MRARFAQFAIDSETRQLLSQGREIHLSPKAFDLLCTLIEMRPKVVDKADLRARIWPNTFVVEANLNILIGEIRRALGDHVQDSRFIRTVYGVGYAFCGDARLLTDEDPFLEFPLFRNVGLKETMSWKPLSRHLATAGCLRQPTRSAHDNGTGSGAGVSVRSI